MKERVFNFEPRKIEVVIPDLIYKFKSLNGQSFKYVQDLFLNRRLYIPVASSLNDPNEGIFKLEIPNNPYEGWANQIENRNQRNQVRVLSFSEVFQNVTLWSHYSDNHRGICIEFATKSLSLNSSNFYKVRYGDTVPIFNRDIHPQGEYHTIPFTNKSTDWSYEKEWRIIKKENEFFINFSDDAITRVILGANISDEDKYWVNFWIESYSPKPAIEQVMFQLDTYEVTLGGNKPRLL